MRKLMLATAALSLAAAPAIAQQFNSTPAGPNSEYQSNSGSYAGQQGWHNQQYGQQQEQGGQHAALRQHIYRELSRAGFSDIRIMPRSFMVHARDSQGNPVMMVVTPNSVTAITAAPRGHASADQYGQNNEANRFGAPNMNGNRGQNGNNWGPTGSSAMNNSAHSGNAINAPNGNGTDVGND